MAKIQWTWEEKAAQKIETVLNDLKLDPESVGRYLARQPLIALVERTQEMVRGFLDENDPYVKPISFNTAYEAGLRGETVEPEMHSPLKHSKPKPSKPTVTETTGGGTSFEDRCQLLTELANSSWAHNNPYIVKQYSDSFTLAKAYNQGVVDFHIYLEEQVNTLWYYILKQLHHSDDTGFETISDLLYNPKPQESDIFTKAELILLFAERYPHADVRNAYRNEWQQELSILETLFKHSVSSEALVYELWTAMTGLLKVPASNVYEVMKKLETFGLSI